MNSVSIPVILVDIQHTSRTVGLDMHIGVVLCTKLSKAGFKRRSRLAAASAQTRSVHKHLFTSEIFP